MCHSIHWINQITRECDSHLCCSNRTEKFHYTPFDLIIDFSVQCSVFVRLINNTHSMVFHQSVEKNRNQINYVGNLSNSVSCNLIRHALHVSIVALLQPLMAQGWCCAYTRVGSKQLGTISAISLQFVGLFCWKMDMNQRHAVQITFTTCSILNQLRCAFV